MPRSGRGSAGPSRAPSRPSAPPPAPARAPQQQQQRGMTTTAQQSPAQYGQPPVAAQGQSPGLFGQMASTAAGVAVGSSIGHAIGGFFGGGYGSSAPAESQQQYNQPTDSYAQPGQAMDSNLYNSSVRTQEPTGPCARDIKSFTDCMSQNNGDMNVCGWYMEQLRACQQAARNY